jgi:hypothetical protein
MSVHNFEKIIGQELQLKQFDFFSLFKAGRVFPKAAR